jgi:hypothetical protein
MYLTITNQDTIDTLALNVVHREREVHQYQINIDNYTAMLAALPQGEIPADIAEFIDKPIEELPSILPLETVQLIADYQYRKRIAFLIRTEAIEQGKAKRVLDALKAQIPADQLDALVAAALAKINAQSAPSV